MIRAPEPPSGCPRAIAPPFGLSRAGSAPVSASQASGTGAKASLTSKTPMSSTERPERASTFAVAGIGAVSMTTGSSPAITVVWMRTSGRRPSSRAFSEVVTSSAADPSEIWLALPALMTPSALNGVFSEASFSSVPPGRMPSSARR